MTQEEGDSVSGVAAWVGLVRDRRPWRSRKVVAAPLQPSSAGGSGAFLALTRDGERYWVKTLNNLQGQRVVITEQIVGRAGTLIDAPVCPVATLYIPKALAGWEFRPGRFLEAGFAHGSLALDTCIERRGLEFRERDENAVRHVGYFALYDWCWGGDLQGLFDLSDDRAMYSHDHGWFLPPVGRRWTRQALLEKLDEPRELGENGGGLDLVEVQRVAARLETLTREDILRVITAIPRTWPVTDQELEAVGAFLEHRASGVARRLRTRFGGGV